VLRPPRRIPHATANTRSLHNFVEDPASLYIHFFRRYSVAVLLLRTHRPKHSFLPDYLSLIRSSISSHVILRGKPATINMPGSALAPGPDESISAKLVAPTSALYVFVLVAYTARIYTRIRPVRNLGWDDVALTVALVRKQLQLKDKENRSNNFRSVDFFHGVSK
jgi:hypothetical protein